MWGCFKHIGMTWDMIMHLPIQDRRALIHKHNMEQDLISNNINEQGSANNRIYQGETLNTFAKMEQSNLKRK